MRERRATRASRNHERLTKELPRADCGAVRNSQRRRAGATARSEISYRADLHAFSISRW